MCVVRYQVGQTKIYFKGGILEELEGRRAIIMQNSAVAIQRIARGLQSRLWYRIMIYSMRMVQSFFRMQKVKAWYLKVRKNIIRVQVIFAGILPFFFVVVY